MWNYDAVNAEAVAVCGMDIPYDRSNVSCCSCTHFVFRRGKQAGVEGLAVVQGAGSECWEIESNQSTNFASVTWRRWSIMMKIAMIEYNVSTHDVVNARAFIMLPTRLGLGPIAESFGVRVVAERLSSFVIFHHHRGTIFVSMFHLCYNCTTSPVQSV